MNIEEKLKHTSLSPQWQTIGIKHHHGIDLSLASLLTEQSCGIGEFFDLVPLIDWCSEIGLDVIQLLPLNDSGDDPSPYFALSAMALNPLFLSLEKLNGIHNDDLKELKKFNLEERVPYHQVQSHKLHFLRSYFEKQGANVVQQAAFTEYVEKNEWVETYGLFKVLKDIMSKNHWKNWPQELQILTEEKKDELLETHWVDVCFYVFLQYLCYKQLVEVKAYANKKGVFLKGDIPILISPDSADVWQYQDEFDLTLSAGAPPDQFTPEGQAWGLPIFKWAVMKERNYDWWKTRLTYASNFYDIYRIDHVLGFYRIWAIPEGEAASNGKFIPENQANWLAHGNEILSLFNDFTPMLPIAEDLGVVPNSIRSSLTDLGICGTRVMRWEREDHRYLDPHSYNPVSMTTVSTHDSETLTQWWNIEEEEARLFAKQKGWDYQSELTKEQRSEILFDSHHTTSLFHVNLLGEYLALFPELVWQDQSQERINVPGTVAPTNWTYRIRPKVEEIIAHKPLREELKKIIT